MLNRRRKSMRKNGLPLAAAAFALALLVDPPAHAAPLSLGNASISQPERISGTSATFAISRPPGNSSARRAPNSGWASTPPSTCNLYREPPAPGQHRPDPESPRREHGHGLRGPDDAVATGSPVGRFSVTASGSRNDFSSNRRMDRREFVGDLQVEYTRDLLFTPAAEIQLQQAQLGLSISRSNLYRRELQLEEAGHQLLLRPRAGDPRARDPEAAARAVDGGPRSRPAQVRNRADRRSGGAAPQGREAQGGSGIHQGADADRKPARPLAGDTRDGDGRTARGADRGRSPGGADRRRTGRRDRTGPAQRPAPGGVVASLLGALAQGSRGSSSARLRS